MLLFLHKNIFSSFTSRLGWLSLATSLLKAPQPHFAKVVLGSAAPASSASCRLRVFLQCALWIIPDASKPQKRPKWNKLYVKSYYKVYSRSGYLSKISPLLRYCCRPISTYLEGVPNKWLTKKNHNQNQVLWSHTLPRTWPGNAWSRVVSLCRVSFFVVFY